MDQENAVWSQWPGFYNLKWTHFTVLSPPFYFGLDYWLVIYRLQCIIQPYGPHLSPLWVVWKGKTIESVVQLNFSGNDSTTADACLLQINARQHERLARKTLEILPCTWRIWVRTLPVRAKLGESWACSQLDSRDWGLERHQRHCCLQTATIYLRHPLNAPTLYNCSIQDT